MRTDLMFRRVAFHNTATSLAYTADPRYHEADALYQVKTKKGGCVRTHFLMRDTKGV